MGHKVNPHGFRLGFNQNWSTHWFSPKSQVANLQEDHYIRQLIGKRFKRSGIAQIELFRNRTETLVVLHTAKPGVVIGRGGKGIQELREQLTAMVRKHRSLGAKDALRVDVRIVEIKSPESNALLVAENIASQIERRIAPKRAMRLATERAMEKRITGIKVQVSGRLNGAEIARTEVMSKGSIPLHTLRTNLDYATALAVTTYGAIGVKVWVSHGTRSTMPEAVPVAATGGGSNRQRR